MRAAVLLVPVLVLPLALAAPHADPAGDVKVTHVVGTVEAAVTPYADCTQPAADVLALDGGASGAVFRLSATLAAWGTDPDCPAPLAATGDARRYTLLALAQGGAGEVSFMRVFWAVDDGVEKPSALLFFRDGRSGLCDGGAFGRDGATLSLECPLAGAATVNGQPRAYDLRGASWTYSAQTNLAVALAASTVRFQDATADVAGGT